MSIEWKQARNDVPKDRRVLLIGTLTDRTHDIAEEGIADVVVGHWDRHQSAFVPVDVPGQGEGRPHLLVTHWAELKIPRGTQLRDIDDYLDI